jgi:NAD(P)-dependent dehydrogenase (short-subunit alcohol dehydrogenase family)
MRLYFDTNATCPAVVTSVFARLLKKSTSPRIVNITSGRGSIERRLDSSDPGYVLLAIPYRASKVDLNMVSACHFVEHEAQGIKVLLYNLGLTMSNLGQINKPEGSAKPTSQAGNLWLRS